jgi:hypothetical protein
MVEIGLPRSLPPDQVVVVGSYEQQLHSTTTTVALLRRCRCSRWHQREISPSSIGQRFDLSFCEVLEQLVGY